MLLLVSRTTTCLSSLVKYRARLMERETRGEGELACGITEQRLVARTANSASVLRKSHFCLLLEFFAKQNPQCIKHKLLKTRIMLVQTVTTAPEISRQPGRRALAAHLPSTPIEYGLPPASDRGATRASFLRQETYPIWMATVATAQACLRCHCKSMSVSPRRVLNEGPGHLGPWREVERLYSKPWQVVHVRFEYGVG